MDRLLGLLPVVSIALGGCGAAPAPSPVSGRVVDLTHPFDAETIYWPTEEGFVHERGFAGTTEAGYYYEAHRFRGAEHGGTHLDAPIHFFAGRWHVDEIPLERLLGPALVVDVSTASGRDRDYRIGIQDLLEWEEAWGPIPEDAILLLRTGFARHWPDRARYLGTDQRGSAALAHLHFPGLHPDAARWLLRERSIRAVGIDTASIDFGQSRDFGSHRVLCERNVPVFENVARLSELPPRGAFVVALPMKIRGGSGGPLRIIAMLPETWSPEPP